MTSDLTALQCELNLAEVGGGIIQLVALAVDGESNGYFFRFQFKCCFDIWTPTGSTSQTASLAACLGDASPDKTQRGFWVKCQSIHGPVWVLGSLLWTIWFLFNVAELLVSQNLSSAHLFSRQLNK